MGTLLAITALFAAVWIIGIFATRYLMKQTRDAMAKQYEMREKKYTWEDTGISDEMLKEIMKNGDFAPEEPPPGFTERVMEKIRAYESSLRTLNELEKGDVIRAHWFARGKKMQWWKDGKPHDSIRNTWFELPIRSRVRNGQIAVYTRPGFDFTNADDPSRGEALFVVEEKASFAKNGSPPTLNELIQIVARRLKDDGSYDPDGELLGIGEDFWGEAPTKVELVGQMNYDWTAMTHTLPKR